MKHYILLISMIMVFSLPCTAQEYEDHLLPEISIFNIYDFSFESKTRLRKELFNGLSHSPEIRFIVLDSFSFDAVLQIEYDREKEKYSLIYHRLMKNIVIINENGETIEPKLYNSVIEIDKSSIDLIKSLFQAAINRTKWNMPTDRLTIGVDGTNYHFLVQDFGPKTGTIWSPPHDSKMGRLVMIGKRLIEFSQSESHTIQFDDDFKKIIMELIDDIEKSN